MFSAISPQKGRDIEIKTLVQMLPSPAADAELSAMLNSGWEIAHMSVSAAYVPGERTRYGVEMPGALQVVRVATMQRIVQEAPEAPAEAAAVFYSNGYQSELAETPTAEEAPEPAETPAAEEAPEPTETPTAEEVPEPAETPTAEEAPEPTETPTAEEAPRREARKVQFDALIMPEEDADLKLAQDYAKQALRYFIDDDLEPTPAGRRAARRVMTRARAEYEQRRAARKPVDEVTFAEALASGLYTAEELKEIGNREALLAGWEAGRRVWERRQAERKQSSWHQLK